MTEPRSASLELPTDVASLGAGRRFITSTLRTWNIDEARIESVTLVVNELLTNAIVHAGSAPVLSLEASGADLFVHVADTSRRRPEERDQLSHDAHGLGLKMVGALSDRWGCKPTATGKTVWATFFGAFA